MMAYDQQLQTLRQQIGQKAHLEAKLEELRNQKKLLTSKVEQLEETKKKEHKDVERLENGIVALFYGIMGMQEKQLDKEKQEACTATAKYDVAIRELQTVEEDVRTCKIRLDNLDRCKERYVQVLKEKTEAMKAMGNAETDEILRLEKELAGLEKQKEEIAEAISAGDQALHTARLVLLKLEDAKEWGIWDAINGKTLSALIKYSYLDEAEDLVKTLQMQLRQFATELVDIKITADIQPQREDFLAFADIFFDNLFSDIAVLGHIHQCKKKIQEVNKQIETVLAQLKTMLETGILAEYTKIENRLHEVVQKASLS